MQAFALSQLIAERQKSGKAYLEFLRAPSMSLGLYVLPAGGVDPQQPHAEDEAYYVISGRAHVRVGGEDRAVQPGDAIFVAARAPHKFHTITEDLTLLVFFAPAESVNGSTDETD
jgi:mannose-6-phosphate isomerase-like protein (cupin superfamily)